MLDDTSDDGLRDGQARVLLVDDDPDYLHMLALAFERAGYAVHRAPNGLEAQEVLRCMTVDLVVTDILMPESDGYELIMRLRRMSDPPPVIALSGGSDRLRMPLPQLAVLLGAAAAFEKASGLTDLLAEAARLTATRNAPGGTRP
ncbi:response regulator [Azospirillum thermophilum]|uniref:Response regulator n=1 Tax=Azospirillum thermophilum TaxID=2202148 RepID=A0A2S2CMK7_9PROT|nr:response regulator [Azospirillum thermophilum]AWK85748.1 response regulator [Azospirillum thermophilum]